MHDEMLELNPFYNKAVIAEALDQVVASERQRLQGDEPNISKPLLASISGRVTVLDRGCQLLLGSLDGECERKLERQREQEQEQEVELPAEMEPVSENHWDIQALLSTPAA
jgi:hypothetical protein